MPMNVMINVLLRGSRKDEAERRQTETEVNGKVNSDTIAFKLYTRLQAKHQGSGRGKWSFSGLLEKHSQSALGLSSGLQNIETEFTIAVIYQSCDNLL